MRGDDPGTYATAASRAGVSPACAGMIPSILTFACSSPCEPRMRGDDPDPRILSYSLIA